MERERSIIMNANKLEFEGEYLNGKKKEKEKNIIIAFLVKSAK